uniref:Uncharacterized protein n=1 Tax=Anopheles culicifacies TaxID=139723 RepID=A0A182MSV1_9DIPT
MMDERTRTSSHHHQQYETYQQRRRCWLVLGRTVLTISVLGLLTIGLYVGSNKIHAVSGETVVEAEDIAPYVAIRERREVSAKADKNGLESPRQRETAVVHPPKQQQQKRRPRKRPTKLPKKTNPVYKTHGNESTDYIFIDPGVQQQQQPGPYHNLSANGEIYQLGENVLQHHPNGGTTIESVLHVTRYKCFKHPHMHIRGQRSGLRLRGVTN